MIKKVLGEKSSLRTWQVKIFSATWLAYVGYYFARKAFYVVKSPLADSLGFTALDLAHLGTAYLVTYMIGQYSSAATIASNEKKAPQEPGARRRRHAARGKSPQPVLAQGLPG